MMDKRALPAAILGKADNPATIASLMTGIPVASKGSGRVLSDPAILLQKIVNSGRIDVFLNLNPHICPDFANGDGWSPLMIAAGRGHVAAVADLAAHPLVDVNRKGPCGLTALHIASLCGHHECVFILLKRGADPSARDSNGHTARDMADNPLVESVFTANGTRKRTMREEKKITENFNRRVTAAAPALAPSAAVPFARQIAGHVPSSKIIFEGMFTDALNPAVLDVSDFAKVFRDYSRRTEAALWDRVFCDAAAAGHTDILEFLYEEDAMPSQHVLNDALYQSLKVGDHDDTVTHLLRIGADAGAVLEDAAHGKKAKGDVKKIYAYALEERRLGAFRQICLWGGKFAGKAELEMNALVYRVAENGMENPGKSAFYKEARRSMERALLQREKERLNAKKIHAEMIAAIKNGEYQNARNLYPLYQQKKDALFSPKPYIRIEEYDEFLKLALAEKDYAFARVMSRRVSKDFAARHPVKDDPQLASFMRMAPFGRQLQSYKEKMSKLYGSCNTGPR